MKAAFTLIPAESRHLIANAVDPEGNAAVIAAGFEG